MSLADWAKNGWLRPHKSSKEEITNLLEIVERDLKDASAKGLSDDWKFGIAYNLHLNFAQSFFITQVIDPKKISHTIEHSKHCH